MNKKTKENLVSEFRKMRESTNKMTFKEINVEIATFRQITKPLKSTAKKSGLNKTDIHEVIHRFRKNKKGSTI